MERVTLDARYQTFPRGMFRDPASRDATHSEWAFWSERRDAIERVIYLEIYPHAEFARTPYARHIGFAR